MKSVKIRCELFLEETEICADQKSEQSYRGNEVRKQITWARKANDSKREEIEFIQLSLSVWITDSTLLRPVTETFKDSNT
jgi:hypothetical protein